MAFSDPQTVKVNGTNDVSVPRTSVKDTSSTYTSNDGLTKLTISTQEGRRKRHTVRIDVKKIIASTLNSSQNEEVSASAYLVLDRPLSGYTVEELRKLAEGLCSFLTSTEGAALKKLVGGES